MQRVFNFRLSHARRIIENVFGITLACCVLHNYLITTNKKHYLPPHHIDQLGENGVVVPGTWRQDPIPADVTMYPLERESHPADAPRAKDVQKEFAAYFVEEGELEWQYKCI